MYDRSERSSTRLRISKSNNESLPTTNSIFPSSSKSSNNFKQTNHYPQQLEKESPSTSVSSSSIRERIQKLENSSASSRGSKSNQSNSNVKSQTRSSSHSNNRSIMESNNSQHFHQDDSTSHSHSQSQSQTPQQHQHQHQQQSRRNTGNTQNNHNSNNNANPEGALGENAVVTPELLVDALSGHEDGLLAIAERLMEHYEGGYDVMGEAIIDAFADVQKLFQHVVEAAHMEGAAFESNRREAEKAAAGGDNGANGTNGIDNGGAGDAGGDGGMGAGQGGPLTRHEEFIDQDVRDILSDAIKQGQGKKEADHFMECYELFEEACNSASALLPVDSDHRGRLQLSIARAESMSPERACAILRYAMDDVLRSGQQLRAHKNPDPSKRGDCVLKPPAGPRSPTTMPISGVATQSHEEALASLVEEMKEVLSAPVYENTPVQEVAMRFWAALEETQKNSKKKEEMLESDLGKLKGEFLMARAEWEEKISHQTNQSDAFKKKYYALKDQIQQHQYMDHARTSAHRIAQKEQNNLGMNNVFSTDASDGLCASSVNRCSPKIATKKSDRDAPNSVASFGSVLGQHARSLVGSFACPGIGSGSIRDNRRGTSPDSARYTESLSPPPSVVSADSINGSSRRSSHFSSRVHSRNGHETKYPISRDI